MVKGSAEAEHDEEEDEDVSSRRVQEVKAERKRRKKERRDERRGSDKAKQQQPLEDGDKLEEMKGASEQSDRVSRGALSWRPQSNAVKEEKKEQRVDSSKLNAPSAVASASVVTALPVDVFSAVPSPDAAERVMPFADVTPPPTIDFPPYSTTASAVATPLASLLKRVGVSCALFTLVRMCVSYVSPAATSIDHNTALMLFLTSILAALFLLSTTLSSLSSVSRSSAAASTASSSLSSELSRYLQAWDLIALDDPQQLLAAYSMTQQMLLSLLHALQPASSSTSPSPSLSPASLVSHAQSILSFLDVAHQHLYSDTGYNPLLDRLLSAASAVRHHIQQLSCSLALRPSTSQSALSSSAVLLQLLTGCCLVGYVVLPCPVLRWSVTSAVVHVLLPAALVALEMLGLFVMLDGEKGLHSSEGVGTVQVDGLLELKQRMDKRMEALIVHTAHNS